MKARENDLISPAEKRGLLRLLKRAGEIEKAEEIIEMVRHYRMTS